MLKALEARLQVRDIRLERCEAADRGGWFRRRRCSYVFFTLRGGPARTAFQSYCWFRRPPGPPWCPGGAQGEAEAWKAAWGPGKLLRGLGPHPPAPCPRPGGSYKKIGYYDSTKDDLSWSKTDKWIGKQALPVFSFSASEQSRESLVHVNRVGLGAAGSLD